VSREILLSFVLSVSFLAHAQKHASTTIVMKSISYAPKVATIKAGDSVVWKNESYTDHSATGSSFDTGMIAPNKSSKPVDFSKPGTYDYHCSMHGTSMSGQIVVNP
jgi:plastocyanin